MTQTAAMLTTHPGDLAGIDRARLIACIEACFDCAQACTMCADACLSEDTIADLRACIRTNLDCADQCEATGRILSRHTGHDAALTRAVLDACAAVCKACAAECARHAEMGMAHCGVCADACHRCEQACCELLNGLT